MLKQSKFPNTKFLYGSGIKLHTSRRLQPFNISEGRENNQNTIEYARETLLVLGIDCTKWFDGFLLIKNYDYCREEG